MQDRTNEGASSSILLRNGLQLHPSSINRPNIFRRGGRVVYCGGLENRFGFTADGGSNPSLSASFNSLEGRGTEETGLSEGCADKRLMRSVRNRV